VVFAGRASTLFACVAFARRGGDRRIAVAEVLDAWLAEYRYFKLKGADGDTYLVRHDERSGIWELTMFRAERL
jgi:hypothetical protein